MEQAVEFAEVLVGAGEQIARALRCLRTGTELGPQLVPQRLGGERRLGQVERDEVDRLVVGGAPALVGEHALGDRDAAEAQHDALGVAAVEQKICPEAPFSNFTSTSSWTTN